jgi:very-short-patch-repair endonuclease
MPGAAVVDVLRRLDGTAPAADLVALCGRPALARAVESGSVLRVARGRYALPALGDPWLVAARLHGVVSHASAAAYWSLDVLNRPMQPQVTVGRHRHHLPRTAAQVHWATLPPMDVDGRRQVTTPLRTVLDCARSLPFEEALAVADSALRLGFMGREELRMAALALRGAGRQRVIRVAHHADGRAGSGLESGLRAIFIRGRINGFAPQLEVQDDGFFARVDLGDRRRRVIAEADSFEHHGHRAALVRDCRRYDELTVRGWRVLRFAWEQVMFEPAWVLGIVRAALANGGARRTGGQKSPR